MTTTPRLLPAGLLAVLAGLTLCSCSSTEPRPTAGSETPAASAEAATGPVSPAPVWEIPVPSDKALVTVYRKKRIVGLALHTSVYVDGVEVAELENGAYVRLAIAPGTHAFHADEEKDTVKVDLEAGKAYFFRMELVPGVWKGNGVMKVVDEKTGASELREWNPKLTRAIRKPEMVFQDPGKP